MYSLWERISLFIPVGANQPEAIRDQSLKLRVELLQKQIDPNPENLPDAQGTTRTC